MRAGHLARPLAASLGYPAAMRAPNPNKPPRQTAERLSLLAPSQIREMMRLAGAVGAVNMAQGRPDFAADPAIRAAAIRAIDEGHNQYSVTWGLPELRRAVADALRRRFGLVADPDREITITCGVTEAMVASLLATVNPGDEVVIIEPAHENYLPAVRFAGGVPRYVSLCFPRFELDLDAVEAALSPKTRVVIVNTPHNPTGRVFSERELSAIAELCRARGALLLTDEIYDALVYDDRPHVAPASLEAARDISITTGGISKIHAVTGWRLGFVVAPPELTQGIRTVHDYLTICAPTPFQYAGVVAVQMPDVYFEGLRAQYRACRDRMLGILADTGFEAAPPAGAYYAMCDYRAWEFPGSTAEFVEHLITDVGVAVVGGPSFYPGHPELGEGLVRFAFAKTNATLDEVHRRLQAGFARRQRPGGPVSTANETAE